MVKKGDLNQEDAERLLKLAELRELDAEETRDSKV